MHNAKEEKASYFDNENSTDVGTFQREQSLASSDDNSSNNEDTSGFESLPIERWRSAILSTSCNLCTHISQSDQDSSSDSESQVYSIFDSPGSYNTGPSQPRSLSFGSTQELKCSPSPPPAVPIPPDHHPSARHSILVVVCLAILFLTARLWQEPEDVLKANGILGFSQFSGNDARVITEVEERKQDGPIEARLSESIVVSIVDRSREMPGAGQSSEGEEANRSKRALMHFLNSEDEPQFLRLSTAPTPSSTQPCLASLKPYSSDQAEPSSREGDVAPFPQPQDIGVTAWQLCYARFRGQWF